MVFALQSWDTLLCGFLYLSLRLGVSLVFEITLIACVIPAFSVLVRIPPSGREPPGHWTIEPGQ